MSVPGRANRGGWSARLAVLTGFAMLAHGCAPTAVPPASQRPTPTTQARPRPRPGYDHRRDDLGSVDTTALRGRRIALDPGHGGSFRGALGVNGLTEAEVNLGVATALRGLLEARGAIVFMTRTDDRDFLTPADSSLRSDLAERTRIANAFGPELFVSIHHNADARGAHDVNETQTYYKLGDEGASLEAAQSVHRYLVRNLGIETQRILPGNYFVLRNSDGAAILTESSYLTNPDVEAKLALAAKQRLEAEALYLGLARYFSRPRPSIEELVAREAEHAPPDTLFEDVAAPVLTARISGAFDDVRLRLDGAPLTVTRAGDAFTWWPPPLAAGRHVATLEASLAGAGTSRTQSLAFTVHRAPRRATATLGSPSAGPHGGLVAVRVAVTDAFGLAITDSVPVRVVATRGAAPRDTVVAARDGIAWAYVRVTPHAPPVNVSATLIASPAHGSIGSMFIGPTPRLPFDERVGFALRMPEGTPLRDAPGTREPRPQGAWINRDGFAVVPLSPIRPVTPDVPELPGYRRWASDADWPPRFVAIGGGALHGKRVVIDPDGGGENDAGTGPSGTRAANLNLDVARALAGFLQAAGADVALTRQGDFALSEVERVQTSEAFHADRFVRIGHRAEPPMLGYYFSSAAGKQWAERTGRMLGALGLAAPPAREDAQYPLQQTSCPALYASPARVDDPVAEERLGSAAAIREEAYAVYLGLLAEWSPAPSAFDSLTVRDASGAAVAGAAVSVGGAALLLTDASGRVRFARTEPGPLEIVVEHPRVHLRRVLLDSEAGVTLTGP